ncbi:MAG TPA: response regulator transcription factor [Terriglobales bacterium]|nr:response regulator transcription factor [Terriglobales bacterium]
MTVSILIADDHDLIRRGLKSLLETRPGWEVCAEADDGRTAVELATKCKPQIAILDVTMPALSGIEATRQILAARPATQILILTMHESEELVAEILESGARGYVLKTDTSRDLLRAVVALIEHKLFFTTTVAEMVLAGYLQQKPRTAKSPAPSSILTAREREVIHLLADGKSNKEIGTALGISTKTAEAHRTNIMRKLNLHSIADVVRYAMRNQLVSP